MKLDQEAQLQIEKTISLAELVQEGGPGDKLSLVFFLFY